MQDTTKVVHASLKQIIKPYKEVYRYTSKKINTVQRVYTN